MRRWEITAKVLFHFVVAEGHNEWKRHRHGDRGSGEAQSEKRENPRRRVLDILLQNVREGDRVPVFIRKATFKLPKDAKAPVILIGPGTGYAPFRGFLQEREYLLKSKKDELGECMLFFGCRKEEHDYIYRDEMEKALSENVISSLNVAFSRDDPKKKV